MKNRIKMMGKHFKKNNIKPNAAVEELINLDNDNALLRARTLSGVLEDELSNPIVIITPNTNTKRNVRFKTTHLEHDDTFEVEYDYSLVTTLLLGNKTLFYHQSAIDYITGRVENDLSLEIAYKDIISTKIIIGNDSVSKPTMSVVKLELLATNQLTLEIPLRNTYLKDNVLEDELLSHKEEAIIKTIKQAIRNSK